MRDLVPGQALEVLRLEPVPVAHLDAVRPALRELAQECVQVRDEVPAMLGIRRPEPGKLEPHEADGQADGFSGLQERLHEQIGVQKVFLGLPGLLA